MILDPWGNYIADPVYRREKIIHGRIEPESWRVSKFQSRGIEARDDLLSLNVAAEAYSPLYRKHRRRFDLSEGSKEEREAEETPKYNNDSEN